MYDSSQNSGRQAPVLLFATPPPLEQLRALTVHIADANVCTNAASKFQPQVIKCREFIFTEPDVIGSPAAEIRDWSFHLVAQASLIKSGRLQTRLARVGLQVSNPYHVTPELYQACLRYTLTARLSPAWNKAGQWLVQGREFLTSKGCANAVQLDLTVNHNELYFSLVATAVKLAPLLVTDLDILGTKLQEFLAQRHALIDRDHIASDWCFVLPSMKRGRIVSISHDLPEDSPFLSYRDLKRHWKNTKKTFTDVLKGATKYGYRLPEDEDGMVYYQVHFGPLGGRLFTYPEVCLRSRDLQTMARVDPKPILRSFIQDVQAKFPTICGHQMKLQSKAKFTVAELLETGQSKQQAQANLTGKMCGAKPSLYRSKTELDKMFAGRPLQITPVQTCSTPGLQTKLPNPKDTVTTVTPTSRKMYTPNITNSSSSANVIKTSVSQKTPVSHNRQSLTFSNKPLAGSSASAHTPSHPVSDTQSQVARKHFPQFKPKKNLMPQLQASVPQQASAGPKLVPIFKAPSGHNVAKTSAARPSFASAGAGQVKPAIKSATAQPSSKSGPTKAKSGKRERKQGKDKSEVKRRKLQKAED